VVRAYLSRQHFEDVENSCPMVALPTDVSRSDQNAKAAFENVFNAMVDVLERSTIVDRRHRRARAQAIAALCVGGMVVARAMANRKAADDLRQGCMFMALQLGGWGIGSEAKRSKPLERQTHPYQPRTSANRNRSSKLGLSEII